MQEQKLENTNWLHANDRTEFCSEAALENAEILKHLAEKEDIHGSMGLTYLGTMVSNGIQKQLEERNLVCDDDLPSVSTAIVECNGAYLCHTVALKLGRDDASYRGPVFVHTDSYEPDRTLTVNELLTTIAESTEMLMFLSETDSEMPHDVEVKFTDAVRDGILDVANQPGLCDETIGNLDALAVDAVQQALDILNFKDLIKAQFAAPISMEGTMHAW